MEELTINQRLKFLVTRLSPSVREFSEAIGESFSNTQNYIGKRAIQPKREYLNKVINHFSVVNAHWLLTGEGEAFLTAPPAPMILKQTQKKIKGNILNNHQGTATQHNYSIADCEKERDGYKAERDAHRKEIEFLKAQLATKDALIASKEETIDLLKTAFNRPN